MPRSGAVEIYDARIGASFSYNTPTKEFLTYDTSESVIQKVEYIKAKALGGSMFWEISADRTDDKSLTLASANKLRSLDRSQNWLSYLQSRYDNIRNGLRG